LGRMDPIALPDFASGAMENWGLVPYREALLPCEEDKASSAQKQPIVSVVTHELAHQGFGNLVTMVWGDALWLNEGFVNWMQCHCADALLPEWRMWEGYVAGTRQPALALNAMRSAHPIQVPIGRAEEVVQIFDAFSYAKGG